MPPALLLLLLFFRPPAGAAEEPRRAYFCDDINRPFFAEVSPGVFRPQRPQALPAQFSLPKPAGTRRVFVLGESVAAILGSGGEGAGGKALALLKALGSAGPAERVEVINCGMSGYESLRIYRVLKEVLAYGPDLLVVLSGNQEGSRGQDCPGADFALRRAELKLTERLYAASGGPQQAWKKASLRFHAGMLKKMAAAAGKAGVPVVFCTLPANSADMPSRIPPRFGSRLFSEGYKLFHERRHREALEKFRAGLAADPGGHFLNFYAGRALRELGRDREAAAHFLAALDGDADMTRATPARNEAIRRAAAGSGACVADLEKLFGTLAPRGLPGFGLFTDGMHWRPAYNKAVWQEIFRSAAACGIKGFETFSPPGGGSETPREDARKRLSYALSWIDAEPGPLNEASLAELAYIRQAQPALLKAAAASPRALEKLLLKNFWSGSLGGRLPGLFPYFLAHLAENERRAGAPAAGLRLCDAALARAADKARLLVLRAQLLAALGDRPAAEKAFRDSGLGGEVQGLAAAYGFPPADGGPAAGPGRAVPERAGGGGQARLQALARLCASTAAAGGAERALAACQEVLAYSRFGGPGLAAQGSDAGLNSYRLLMALGREEEALETLAWCVGDAPADWPGLNEARRLLEDRRAAARPGP